MAFRSGGVEFGIKLNIDSKELRALSNLNQQLALLSKNIKSSQDPAMALAQAQKQLASSYQTSAKALAVMAQAQKDAAKSMSQAKQAADQMSRSHERAADSTQLLGNAISALGLGYLANEMARVVKESTLLAARVGVLSTVAENMGRISGYSAGEVKALEQSVERMGITSQASMQAIAMLSQSQLDLSKAAELARISQDSAVIAGTNSSEAMERIVLGIRNQSAVLLRFAGINVLPEESFKRFADEAGRTVESLSAMEKQEAILQAVLKYGDLIRGNYERSMQEIGKQLTSMPRYIEQASLALGQQFTPALEVVVPKMTDLLIAFEKSENAQKFAAVLSSITIAATGATASLVALRAASLALSATGLMSWWLALPAAIGLAAGAITLYSSKIAEQRKEIEALKDASVQQVLRAQDMQRRLIDLQRMREQVERNEISQRRWNHALAEMQVLYSEWRQMQTTIGRLTLDKGPFAESGQQQIARLTAQLEEARKELEIAGQEVEKSKAPMAGDIAGTPGIASADSIARLRQAAATVQALEAQIASAKETMDMRELRRLDSMQERMAAAYTTAAKVQQKYNDDRIKGFDSASLEILDSFQEYRRQLIGDVMSEADILRRSELAHQTRAAEIEKNYAARSAKAKTESEQAAIRTEKEKALLNLSDEISSNLEEQLRQRREIIGTMQRTVDLARQQLESERRDTADLQERLRREELGQSGDVVAAEQQIAKAVRLHEQAVSELRTRYTELREKQAEAREAAERGEEGAIDRLRKIDQEVSVSLEAITAENEKSAAKIKELQKDLVEAQKESAKSRLDAEKSLHAEIAELEESSTAKTASEAKKRIDARKQEAQQVGDFLRSARVRLLNEKLPGLSDIVSQFDAYKAQIGKAQSAAQLGELSRLFPESMASTLKTMQDQPGGQQRTQVAKAAVAEIMRLIQIRSQELQRQRQEQEREVQLVAETLAAKRTELSIATQLREVEVSRSDELERQLLLHRQALALRSGDTAAYQAAMRDMQLFDARRQQRQAELAAVAKPPAAAPAGKQAQPEVQQPEVQQPAIRQQTSFADLLSQARAMRQRQAAPLSPDEQRARAQAVSARKRGYYNLEMMRRQASHALGRDVRLGDISSVRDQLITTGAAGGQAAQAMGQLNAELGRGMQTIRGAFQAIDAVSQQAITEIRETRSELILLRKVMSTCSG